MSTITQQRLDAVRSEHFNLRQQLKVEQQDHQKAVHKLLKAQAHAGKLAEALNVAQATIERLKQRYALGSVDGTLDVIFKALAAYEESRQ